MCGTLAGSVATRIRLSYAGPHWVAACLTDRVSAKDCLEGAIEDRISVAELDACSQS